jgi:hypothetical protein
MWILTGYCIYRRRVSTIVNTITITCLTAYFFTYSTILSFQLIQTYIVDTFTLHAASGTFYSPLSSLPSSISDLANRLPALAAVSFLRSCAGFGFPLFAPAMYKTLGYGKGDTILAVLAIIIGCPAYVFSSVGFRAIVDSCACLVFIGRGYCGFMGRGYGLVASMGEKSRYR